jgi:hypothetical protein
MANKGQCLCGTVTWEITGQPHGASHCHCSMCRKAHGAAFATYWTVAPGDLRFISGTDAIVVYPSSPTLPRAFCGTCGAKVPFAGAEGAEWSVPAGGHEEGPAAEAEIFVASRAPWFTLTSDLPRHDAYPAGSGLPSIERPVAPPRTDGKVGGSCLCGAVAFEITAPFRTARHCHCSRCRHGRAAAHASNAFAGFDDVVFLRGGENLATFKLPEARFFAQTFCRTCGSLMPRRDPERQITVVPMGSLDDDPGIRPGDHVHVGSKAGWFTITDDLPRNQEGPPPQ